MMQNKKNQPWICGILILIIACSLCVGTCSAMVEDSPYIMINPVGDHAIGEIITISGTTNFPVNTTLWIQAGPKKYTKYPPHYIGEKVQIVQGTNSNLWSIKINTLTFAIDEYNVLVSPLINDSSIFSYTRFNITARHTGTLQATFVSSTTTAGDSAISLDIKEPPQAYKVFVNLPEPPNVTVIGYVRNMELQSIIISSSEGSTNCGNTSFISCMIPVTKGLNRITITATDSDGTRVSTTRNFSVEYGVPTPPLRITISGKITTPDEHPIEGATVRTEFFMTYDTQSVTVESEADGSYRINNAHGFNQKISVEKNGYANVTKEMSFNKNVNTVDFTLEPTTQPASGFTAVLCLVAILGSVMLIIFRKERTR